MKALVAIENICRDDMPDRLLGSMPVNRFIERSRLVSFERREKNSGKVPVKRLLLTWKDSRRVHFSKDDGSEPVTKFPPKDNEVM